MGLKIWAIQTTNNIQSAFHMIHPAASEFCVNQSLMFLQMMSSSKLCDGTKYTVIYHTLIQRSGKISAALFTFLHWNLLMNTLITRLITNIIFQMNWISH